MDPIIIMMAILMAPVVLALAAALVLIVIAASIYTWIHVYFRLKAVLIHPHVPLPVFGPLLMLIALANAVVVFPMMFIRRFFARCTAGIESGYFGARWEAMGFRVKASTLKGIGCREKTDELSGDLAGDVLDRATVSIMKAGVRLEPYIP